MGKGERVKVLKVDSVAIFSSDNYSKISIKDAQGLLRLLCFEPGQYVPLHKHLNGDEYFYVIKGKGKVTIGKEEEEVGPGCIVKASAGVSHQWKNGPQRLVILSVIIPPQSYKSADEATKMEST